MIWTRIWPGNPASVFYHAYGRYDQLKSPLYGITTKVSKDSSHMTNGNDLCKQQIKEDDQVGTFEDMPRVNFCIRLEFRLYIYIHTHTHTLFSINRFNSIRFLNSPIEMNI